ncbi:MAG: urease accessory protein UreD [Alphaproteobacteria bacterium]
MYDGAWRSEAADGEDRRGGQGARDGALARNDGAAEVGFGSDGRLVHLFQSTPCRVAFPRPESGDLSLGVFITTSGGLAGGDRLRFRASVAAGGRAMVTTQAAEKIYRSLGADTRVDVAVEAGPGAWVEWLPQETIVFDRARLRRRTDLHLAAGARAMAGELVVLGRAAHGETFRRGLLRDEIRLHRDGRLVWMDALHLVGDDVAAIVAAAAGFGGGTALATGLYAAEDAPARLEEARASLAERAEVRAGATVVNGILVVRMLGDPFSVRRAFGLWWTGFRAAAAGLPARLPRLWSV